MEAGEAVYFLLTGSRDLSRKWAGPASSSQALLPKSSIASAPPAWDHMFRMTEWVRIFDALDQGTMVPSSHRETLQSSVNSSSSCFEAFFASMGSACL